MANAQVFEVGYEQGLQRGSEGHLRKQALKDKEFLEKHDELVKQRDAIQANLSQQLQGTPDYDKAVGDLTNAEQAIRMHWHPAKNPGMLGKFGNKLTDALRLTSPERRQETTDKKLAQGREQDTQATQRDIASAPLSLEQQAAAKSRASTAELKANLDAANELWDKQNPNATEDQKRQAYHENFQSIILGRRYTSTRSGKADIQDWILADGKTKITTRWDAEAGAFVDPATGEPVGDQLEGATMVPKASAQGKAKGLSYVAATGMVRDGDTGKLYSIDDIGKEGSPPELSAIFHGAKKEMDEKQQRALALADKRGESFASHRYGAFIDPNSPGQVMPVPFGEAAKRGLHLAVGANYQTMAAMLKAATSGPIGNEIVAFSTALQHADLLERAAQNLGNQNTRLFNTIANDLLTQFGDERPTDFNTIAGAYTREVTKALTSGHVTDNEITQNGLTIPQNASPTQILGAITAYRLLMASKINIRKDQILHGMTGVPMGTELPTTPKTAKKHKIKIGDKFYEYNGTGDTGDLKNYTEVKK